MPRGILLLFLLGFPASGLQAAEPGLFNRDNLVAWCIVPFDAQKRGPEERAAMLARLGIRQLAYDWRDEHIPTFDAEVEACARHGVRITAWWINSPELNEVNRRILDVVRRHRLKLQFWVMMVDPAEPDQAAKVRAASQSLHPFAEAAAAIDCQVGLYNHGGWFGEPENQLAIIDELQLPNVGIVYNQHHGHAHVDSFAALLEKMKPHLLALNLNGMFRDGDAREQKIMPIGTGERDLQLLRTIQQSGYRGPIGILNHTDLDAEARLADNLAGLEWLVPQLDGTPAAPFPKLRTYEQPPSSANFDPAIVDSLLTEAQSHGDARRGAAVFSSQRFACVSCHKVGTQGGAIGPDLTTAGICLKPTDIVESFLWPKRLVKKEYSATVVHAGDGRSYQGYVRGESDDELTLWEAATGETLSFAKDDIEERHEIGTLMPDGLAAAMTPHERRDVVRFLLDLGRAHTQSGESLLMHAHTPAEFDCDFAPLNPDAWPLRFHAVNRDRLYDFYTKEAEFFRTRADGHGLLPAFPGIDGGRHGHWGNQDEKTWADDRWNNTELGSVMCGVLHGPDLVVPRAVCVQLGEHGELSACFNPDTLSYDAVWSGGFVKFSSVRHGFMDGLLVDGELVSQSKAPAPNVAFQYRGFYRHGNRVVFAYRIGDVEYLDAPWVENGKFVREVAPSARHSLRHLTTGGPAQWPQVLETSGTLGYASPYALDTIGVPFDNPWRAPMFFGGHDFLSDGAALLCTMQGDVWRVEGLDDKLDHVRWRRFASGLHHALGLVVADDKVYVLGRDQITRLHDPNEDGEADFYECFSSAFTTSPAGHDFICGLERDSKGHFYAASGNQGLLRISADGRHATVLATGFRNPDGLGLMSDGSVTVPCSEGEWTPTSMICHVPPRVVDAEKDVAASNVIDPPFFGYGGPRNDAPPDVPMVYLPRGLDNSAGGQVHISSDRWGPLAGNMLHFSYGAGTHFLLLRDVAVEGPMPGQVQGAVVPLPGGFASGVHRGRFAPHDGQLYVTGMGGWGTYTVADGAFQRVRYTGNPVQLPIGFQVRRNGVLVTFGEVLEPQVAGNAESHFAQAWNYRYSAAYGSQEYAISHPDTVGHDRLAITSAHVLPDGKKLFLELPDLQPVNQLHLRVRANADLACDLFMTVHGWHAAFTEFPGYLRRETITAAHPILSDLTRLTQPALPNPWREPIEGARPIEIAAGKNLSFSTRSLTAHPGEPLALTFTNPDVVPHNWVLLKSDSLTRVGELVNHLVAEPDAAVRHYVPKSDDVLVYVDVTPAGEKFTVYFTTPKEPGRYPYLCSFPGHWMAMNGELIVEGEPLGQPTGNARGNQQ